MERFDDTLYQHINLDFGKKSETDVAQLVETLGRYPTVRSILSIGSAPSGNATVGSDFDFIMIHRPEIMLAKDRLRLIAPHLKGFEGIHVLNDTTFDTSFGVSDDFVLNTPDSQEVCLQHYTYTSFCSKIDRIGNKKKYRKEDGLYFPLSFFAALSNSVPLVDKDNVHPKILQEVNPQFSKLRTHVLRTERELIPYYISNLEKALSRDEMALGFGSLNQILESFMHYFSILNHQYPRGWKRLYEQSNQLTYKPSGYVETLRFVVEEGNTPELLSQKLELIKALNQSELFQSENETVNNTYTLI